MDNVGGEAILVLGMHRSGTSAVAGALSLLGAAPPAHIVPVAPDNPSGFWGSEPILGTNDWILNQGAATWYDCLGFDPDALDARRRGTALTFIMLCMMTEFADAALPLIKDPRICLLLDLWLPALRARATTPVVVLVLRSPGKVVESLTAREHLPAAITTALWLRHMLDAEFATRFCRRHVVLYDDLLRDWREALTLAGQRTAIAWPIGLEAAAPRMDRFIDARLRHFGPVGRRNAVDAMPFAGWLEEAFAALRGLGRDPSDQFQLQRIDRVRTAFRMWSRAHGRTWAEAFLHRHEIRAPRPFEVPAGWHQIAKDIPDAITLPVE
jgi:hypothetical protein